MRLTKERIKMISRDLVAGLTARHLIGINLPEAELTKKIETIIIEELMLEDRLDVEVRQILQSYASEIQKGDADSRKMFLLIKKKLAKERGIIL